MPPFLWAPYRRLREAACILAVVLLSGCASAPAVTSASGRVEDVHDRPVAGARVTVKTHWSKVLGTGVTGPDGGFSFALTKHWQHGAEPELSVDADGFMHWSQDADWTQLAGYPVILARKIDAGYLTALRSVSDPAERIWRMDEILSIWDTGEDPKAEWQWGIERLFPFLGELREDLIAASTRPARTADDASRSDRALMLLAFWDDPRDHDLLAPWLAKNTWFAEAPSPVQAPSLDTFCSAWAAVHFSQNERLSPPWPPYYCTPAVIDPDQTRALMFFQVEYVHWRYNMYLVLRHDDKDGSWRLHWVVEGITDDLIDE